MKHAFGKATLAFALFLGFGTSYMSAQVPALPMDKEVRVGKLDNGLTYYIRHNELPKNRVQFHIAQKVGAILELPQQRGLAHFLEHMCFNGTQNFPGNDKGLGIVPWCQSHSLVFGRDLNAYTGVDETVYRITNVPTTAPSVVDSCLLILHDWSHALLLEKGEIDKERGVIREELRSRDNAQMRNLQKIAEQVYGKDSKYADCLPGGSVDVVNNFDPKVLRDYYHKWYRPDLQGIIIVGDIDVDKMEARVKEMFADVPAPVNPAKRIYYPVPDNDDMIVAIAADKEATRTLTSFEVKSERMPRQMRGSMMFLAQDYVTSMISSMLNKRYEELAQKSDNPPYAYAGADFSDFFLSNMTKSSFDATAIVNEKDIEGGFKALVREVFRAAKFGFTPSEYARARAEYLRKLESIYNDRDKQKNGFYAQQYIRHFISGDAIPSIETEYAMVNQIAPKLPVAAINQTIASILKDKKNRVITLTMPIKDGVTVPTKEDMKKWFAAVESEKLTPYVDEVIDEPLISEDLTPGKIVKTSEDKTLGTTTWVFSNGAKVILKKTDFKKDEIIMNAYSKGGTSLYGKDRYYDFASINESYNIGGLGKFDDTTLTKLLSGKIASVNASVNLFSETISANCSPKDLETMLQLNYLTFTAPRKDDKAANSYKNRMKAILENAEKNPATHFRDSLTYARYGDEIHTRRFKAADLDKVNYASTLELYKERFANAGDFTFYVVGNIDLDTAKPLFEKYIGSLPDHKVREKANHHVAHLLKGHRTLNFYQEQDMKKTTAFIGFHMPYEYNLKTQLISSIYGKLMDIRCTETMREDEGGTYGAYVRGTVTDEPEKQAVFFIYFDTDPAKFNRLTEIAKEQMKDIAENGPKEVNMKKVLPPMLKKFESNLKENKFWMNAIKEYDLDGIDNVNDYTKVVNSITKKDIQDFAKKILKAKSTCNVSMTSASCKKEASK